MNNNFKSDVEIKKIYSVLLEKDYKEFESQYNIIKETLFINIFNKYILPLYLTDDMKKEIENKSLYYTINDFAELIKNAKINKFDGKDTAEIIKNLKNDSGTYSIPLSIVAYLSSMYVYNDKTVTKNNEIFTNVSSSKLYKDYLSKWFSDEDIIKYLNIVFKNLSELLYFKLEKEYAWEKKDINKYILSKKGYEYIKSNYLDFVKKIADPYSEISLTNIDIGFDATGSIVNMDVGLGKTFVGIVVGLLYNLFQAEIIGKDLSTKIEYYIRFIGDNSVIEVEVKKIVEGLKKYIDEKVSEGWFGKGKLYFQAFQYFSLTKANEDEENNNLTLLEILSKEFDSSDFGRTKNPIKEDLSNETFKFYIYKENIYNKDATKEVTNLRGYLHGNLSNDTDNKTSIENIDILSKRLTNYKHYYKVIANNTGISEGIVKSLNTYFNIIYIFDEIDDNLNLYDTHSGINYIGLTANIIGGDNDVVYTNVTSPLLEFFPVHGTKVVKNNELVKSLEEEGLINLKNFVYRVYTFSTDEVEEQLKKSLKTIQDSFNKIGNNLKVKIQDVQKAAEVIDKEIKKYKLVQKEFLKLIGLPENTEFNVKNISTIIEKTIKKYEKLGISEETLELKDQSAIAQKVIDILNNKKIKISNNNKKIEDAYSLNIELQDVINYLTDNEKITLNNEDIKEVEKTLEIVKFYNIKEQIEIIKNNINKLEQIKSTIETINNTIEELEKEKNKIIYDPSIISSYLNFIPSIDIQKDGNDVKIIKKDDTKIADEKTILILDQNINKDYFKKNNISLLEQIEEKIKNAYPNALVLTKKKYLDLIKKEGTDAITNNPNIIFVGTQADIGKGMNLQTFNHILIVYGDNFDLHGYLQAAGRLERLRANGIKSINAVYFSNAGKKTIEKNLKILGKNTKVVNEKNFKFNIDEENIKNMNNNLSKIEDVIKKIKTDNYQPIVMENDFDVETAKIELYMGAQTLSELVTSQKEILDKVEGIENAISGFNTFVNVGNSNIEGLESIEKIFQL